MFYCEDGKRFNLPTHDLVNAFDAQNDNIRKQNSIKFDIELTMLIGLTKITIHLHTNKGIQDGTQHIYILDMQTYYY